MLPGPMEYLKSHAIAFLAGASSVVLVRLYVKLNGRKRQ